MYGDAFGTTHVSLRAYVQVMLFTYTDKDGFVPPSDKTDGSVGGRRNLTTGDGGPHSYLEEAVTNMPRKTATSSAEPSAAANGARGAVSETAAIIQAHLAREDKVKVSRTSFSESSKIGAHVSGISWPKKDGVTDSTWSLR